MSFPLRTQPASAHEIEQRAVEIQGGQDKSARTVSRNASSVRRTRCGRKLLIRGEADLA